MRTRDSPGVDETAAGCGSCAFTALGTMAVAVALVWYIFNDPLAMAELDASPASFWWGMLVGGVPFLALSAGVLYVVALTFLRGVELARGLRERRNAGAASRNAPRSPEWKPWALATLLSVGVLATIFALWGDPTGEDGTDAIVGLLLLALPGLIVVLIARTRAAERARRETEQRERETAEEEARRAERERLKREREDREREEAHRVRAERERAERERAKRQREQEEARRAKGSGSRDRRTTNDRGQRGGQRHAGGRDRPGRPQATVGSAYEVLGVAPGASEAEIVAAYRRHARMYHPDRVAGLGPEFQELAERKMKEINAAYEELRPDKRPRRP